LHVKSFLLGGPTTHDRSNKKRKKGGDSNTLDLDSDASGTLGFGSIFVTKWFQGKWKPHH
jgi:hypothetical protein